MTKTRSGIIYIAGLLTGMTIINIVNIIGYCRHGLPGGEVVMLLMIPPAAVRGGASSGRSADSPRPINVAIARGIRTAWTSQAKPCITSTAAIRYNLLIMIVRGNKAPP